MFLFLTALSDFDGALYVDVAVFQTSFVSCQRSHFLRCSYFEPASMLVRCDPRHRKSMAYGLIYRGVVVPKVVDAAVAAIKTSVWPSTTERCRELASQYGRVRIRPVSFWTGSPRVF